MEDEKHERTEARRPARAGCVARAGPRQRSPAHEPDHPHRRGGGQGLRLRRRRRSSSRWCSAGAQSGKPYLLLVSGANRVDEKAAGERIGEPLRRPDAQDVRDITGFAIGGIPPLGHDTPLATFMDEALLAHAVVWAAAGTPDAVFPIAPAQLAEATAAIVIPVG